MKLLPFILCILPVITDDKSNEFIESTDPDDYVGCWQKHGTRGPVIFINATETAFSLVECLGYCKSHGYLYAAFYHTKEHYCFCGNNADQDSSCGCSQNPEPEVGGDVCSRVYLGLASDAVDYPEVQVISPNGPVSSWQNATIIVAAINSATSYTWDFGDGSDVLTTTGPSVLHAYLLPGSYIIHIEARGAVAGETYAMVSSHHILVLDPPRLSKLNTPVYVDGTSGQPVDVSSRLEQGSHVGITWSRTDPDGKVIRGKCCHVYLLVDPPL